MAEPDLLDTLLGSNCVEANKLGGCAFVEQFDVRIYNTVLSDAEVLAVATIPEPHSVFAVALIIPMALLMRGCEKEDAKRGRTVIFDLG